MRHWSHSPICLSALLFMFAACGVFGANDSTPENNQSRDPTRVCTPSPVGRQLSVDRDIDLSDFLGVNLMPQMYAPGEAGKNYSEFIDAVTSLGLKKIRIPVHWSILEPQRNSFSLQYLERLDRFMSLAADAGFDILLYFHSTPEWQSTESPSAPFYGLVPNDAYPPKDFDLYSERAAMLVERYRGVVKMFSVWNEPNSPGFWAPAVDERKEVDLYGALQEKTYTRLKRQYPDVAVLSAGMAYFSELHPLRFPGSPYMFDLLHDAGSLEFVDAVAHHPYFHRPEGNEGDGNPYDFVETALERNATLRSWGVGEIYATEFGWSTYTGPEVEEQPYLMGSVQQGDYIVRRLLLLVSAGYSGAFLFTLADFPKEWAEGRDKHYGLVFAPNDPENPANKKDSFHVLRGFLDLVGHRVEQAEPLAVAGAREGLHSVTFQSGGRLFWAGWTCSECEKHTVTVCGVVKGRVYGPVHLMGGPPPEVREAQDGLQIEVEDELRLVEILAKE